MRVVLQKLEDDLWRSGCYSPEQHQWKYRCKEEIPEALFAWFRINGIWLRSREDNEEKQRERIEYNGVYHFWDWKLFFWDEIREKEVRKVEAFLQEQGYRVEITTTWTWYPKDVQVDGLRFMIYPTEERE